MKFLCFSYYVQHICVYKSRLGNLVISYCGAHLPFTNFVLQKVPFLQNTIKC
ncbi:hypothetical protein I79_017307 [Cricetulus griseus]|uniref:Uncharacterized protein n=1 Tax=Cricetulus griseus TaxID=10029 RepID=G3I1P4_CRIGR|nr:hypothetical protein I79_017307 [Cricetulus griseus]